MEITLGAVFYIITSMQLSQMRRSQVTSIQHEIVDFSSYAAAYNEEVHNAVINRRLVNTHQVTDGWLQHSLFSRWLTGQCMRETLLTFKPYSRCNACILYIQIHKYIHTGVRIQFKFHRWFGSLCVVPFPLIASSFCHSAIHFDRHPCTVYTAIRLSRGLKKTRINPWRWLESQSQTFSFVSKRQHSLTFNCMCY